MKSKSFSTGFLKCFALLLIVAIPLAAQSKKEREQAKKLQDQADKAFKQKDYRVAADTYGSSLAVVANNAYAHYWKGNAHVNLKENVQAINEFTLALSQGFKPIDIYRVRWSVYKDQKDYAGALGDIQAGLKLEPKDLYLLGGLGEINLEQKAYPEALAAFQKVSLLAPNDADVYFHLARINHEIGDSKAQEAAASMALSKGTRFPGESYFLLGDAHQKLRNREGAIDAFQRAIAAKFNVYDSYRRLATLYAGENRFNDAIDTSKKALMAFPRDGNIYTDLGWYYSLADRPNDAVQASKAGVDLLPTQYHAYTYLCRAYIEVGRAANDAKNYDFAITSCNTALKLKPDDGETYFYLGNAYVSQGKSADADRMYSKAFTGLTADVATDAFDSDKWYLFGGASLGARRYDKAIEAYAKSLEISPKFLKARFGLGLAYTYKRDKTAATEQYNILFKADPTYAARLKAEIDKM